MDLIQIFQRKTMQTITTILIFIAMGLPFHGSGIANPDNRRIVDFLMEYETMTPAEIRAALEIMPANDIQLIFRILGYAPSPYSPISLDSESVNEISSYTPPPRQSSSDDENEKDAEYP